MNEKTVIIRYPNGKMKCVPGIFISAPLAKLRKLILPYMVTGCTEEDKKCIIDTLYSTYTKRAARKDKSARGLYNRITEICTACGMEAPEAVKPAEISAAAVDNTAAEIVPAAAPDFVGKSMIAYPREKKPEAPKSKPKSKHRNPAEFVGRKMVITIGERAARPAAD